MKTTFIKIGNRKSEIGNFKAFTLVELLVVISIIGVLAALLLPAIAAAKIRAQKAQARLQISDIVTAIQQYDSAYSRFPVSPAEQTAGTNDFTFGGIFQIPALPVPVSVPIGTYINGSISTNRDVIAILMDITTNNVTHEAPNWNHQKNPQQTIFLNATMASYTGSAGVGPDLVYCDPWGNPYVITMDLSYDEQCNDAFYSQKNVSQIPNIPPGTNPTHQLGYNGLVNPNSANPDTDNFLYHGKVMVWSAGPDKMIDSNAKANAGVNKDNVLSWQ